MAASFRANPRSHNSFICHWLLFNPRYWLICAVARRGLELCSFVDCLWASVCHIVPITDRPWHLSVTESLAPTSGTSRDRNPFHVSLSEMPQTYAFALANPETGNPWASIARGMTP